MMHSFPFSARILLLPAVILLSNTTPLTDSLSIARTRSPVSNDVAVHPRAIDAKDPFDSNGNQQRDGIFGPEPEPDQDVAAVIPRVFIPTLAAGSRPQPNYSRLDENTLDEDAPDLDMLNNGAPKDTPEGDTHEEGPSKPHGTGHQSEKHPKSGHPKKCDDGNGQEREPCPSETPA